VKFRSGKNPEDGSVVLLPDDRTCTWCLPLWRFDTGRPPNPTDEKDQRTRCCRGEFAATAVPCSPQTQDHPLPEILTARSNVALCRTVKKLIELFLRITVIERFRQSTASIRNLPLSRRRRPYSLTNTLHGRHGALGSDGGGEQVCACGGC